MDEAEELLTRILYIAFLLVYQEEDLAWLLRDHFLAIVDVSSVLLEY